MRQCDNADEITPLNKEHGIQPIIAPKKFGESRPQEAKLDAQKTRAIRDALAAFRASLIAERQELIKQELELYTLV